MFLNCTYAQNYYELGYKQYYEGNDDKKSIELFTKAIQNGQEPAKSYMLRAAAKISLNDLGSVVQDLESSLKLDSNNYKTYYYYGRFYFIQGFYKNSLKYYDKAIAREKKSANSYDERAIARGEVGDFKGAISDETKAISIDPSQSSFYVNRGHAKLKLKLFNESIEDFDKAIQLANDPQGYANRGVANLELKQFDKAISDLTVGIAKLPDAKDLPYHRAMAYSALGKNNEACEDLSKSMKLGYAPAKNKHKEICSK